ncbi:MAG: class II aldolase/adducin family protein [bacterium]|nr:class II aldolase/adducin family protein [bacterium]
MTIDKAREELKRYSRLAYELGLVWGTSGNMSVRVDKDHFLITASSANLREISSKELVTCSLHSDTVTCGNPSMEFRMHRRIYIAREDVFAILHSHPCFSTLIACSLDFKIKKEIIPESIAYLGKIERISYSHPGSKELAEEVGRRSAESDTLLLENHGVVCVGASLKDVINKTETMEFLSRLIILAKAAGVELKVLPEDTVRGLRQRLKDRFRLT